MKSKWIYWFFLAPCLLGVIFTVIVPAFSGFVYSFTEWNGISDEKTLIGFDNYINVFNDKYFWHSFKFTILFVVAAVIVINLLAFVLALLVTQGTKADNVFRSLYFMPNMIGGVLVGFTWLFIIRNVFDSIGSKLGWGFLCDWLSTEKTGFMGLLIVVAWQMSGYIMLIYIAQLQNIPRELLDAAAIDGANRRQRFTKIKLPLMMPAFTIGLFMTITNCFKIYERKSDQCL